MTILTFIFKEREDTNMENSGRFTWDESREERARKDVIDLIWNIAKISPYHGNALTDFLGDEKYKFVMDHHNDLTRKQKEILESIER